MQKTKIRVISSENKSSIGSHKRQLTGLDFQRHSPSSSRHLAILTWSVISWRVSLSVEDSLIWSIVGLNLRRLISRWFLLLLGFCTRLLQSPGGYHDCIKSAIFGYNYGLNTERKLLLSLFVDNFQFFVSLFHPGCFLLH